MNPSTLRVDVVGLALAGLVCIALTVCAVAGVPAPEFLATLGVFALGLGGGAALPSRFTGASTTAASPSDTAPAPLPLSSAQRANVDQWGTDLIKHPEPAPYRTAEPATGVFGRIVTGDH